MPMSAKSPKIRLVSVTRSGWGDDCPESPEDMSDRLLRATQELCDYTFTGSLKPKLMVGEILVFRFEGKLIGEGVFKHWDKKDNTMMWYCSATRYDNFPTASKFIKPGANRIAFISDDQLISIRKAGKAKDSGGGINADPRVVDDAASIEGRRIVTVTARRERLKKNRDACLAALPLDQRDAPPCAVCSMNFLERYGEIGRRFIHVHHLRPSSSLDVDGELVVPMKDLAPVCPNCHAMLHHHMDATKGEVRSIPELKLMMGL